MSLTRPKSFFFALKCKYFQDAKQRVNWNFLNQKTFINASPLIHLIKRYIPQIFTLIRICNIPLLVYQLYAKNYNNSIQKKFFLFSSFIFREKGMEGERGGEKHQCVVALLQAPYWGPGLQPRHVP